IPIVGDAKNILPRLTAEYRALAPEPTRLEEWWSRIRGWQERHPLGYEDSKEPRRWINSGGLGTMGFGLPAAMGAQVGCPEDTVVCIAGDGSVQMNMQELATCAEEKIP